jgi:hypothetical protein
MFDVLFPCDWAPTLKEERRLFFPVGFIFAVPSWHARQNLPTGECARWRRAHQSMHFVLSLFFGGGLFEDHDVGGMIMIPDLAQTLVITLVTFAILELQPLFK